MKLQQPAIDTINEIMSEYTDTFELMDEMHSQGICTSCGSTQHGVEPDAEGYKCEACGEHTVTGFEQAVFLM